MHRIASILAFSAWHLVAQAGFSQQPNPLVRSVYLLGNTADLPANDPVTRGLASLTASEEAPFTLLHLGDMLGSGRPDSVGTPLASRQENLSALLGAAIANPKGNALLIPGDRDWGDAGPGGWEQVRQLEDFWAKAGHNRQVFLPREGCPGPSFVDLGDDLRIIAINTPWFSHPFDKPDESDVLCDVYNTAEFWGELDELIEQAPHRNIILAGHHPVLSYGQYAGYKSLKQHLFPLTAAHEKLYLPMPLLGSFYASFRRNVGTAKDLSKQQTEAFAERMKKLLQNHHHVVYASCHELDVQALRLGTNFHLNSGSLAEGRAVAKGEETLFRSKERGFVRLQYFADGSLVMQFFQLEDGALVPSHEQMLLSGHGAAESTGIAANERYPPSLTPPDASLRMPKGSPQWARVVPSTQYQVADYRRKLFGEHYRNTWATPVEVPVLDLDTVAGGLLPSGKGGGAQSKVLKLSAADGKSYNFRSVDKYPSQSHRVNHELLGGWYGEVLQDMISGLYPYSALVADKLMDAAGIRHVSPRLYVMPSHPKLGEYRTEFGGMLGFLELRPKGSNKGLEGFQGAEKVVKTGRLFQHLIADHDHSMDATSYAKARLFDLLVADWDRTFDNWRFMAYGDKKALTFYAMPKDRDRAFSKWQGIYWLADREFGNPDLASFGYRYGDFKSLTQKDRNIDRMLLNQLSWADWERIAATLKAELTDEVIRDAVAQVPAAARAEAEALIGEVLKARRDQLMEAAFRFYQRLAAYVDVIGSNKREIFEVKRLPAGDVELHVFKKKKTGEKGELLYQRLLRKSETREIRLYGLGGADEFHIEGTADKSILVRIIPGDGADLVEDQSEVRRPSPLTKVYGQPGEDTLRLSKEAKRVRTPEEVKFTYQLYEPHSYRPLPAFIYNQEDSIGLGMGMRVVRQGFKKPGYAKKYYLRGAATLRHSFWLDASAEFRHVAGKWDLELVGKATNVDRSMRHFYGIGNETVKDSLLYLAGFYENHTNSQHLRAGLRREFWRRSHFTAAAKMERYVVTNDSNSLQLTDMLGNGPLPLRGMGANSYLGSTLELDLDLTDGQNLPTQGLRLQLGHRYFFNVSEKGSRFGKFSADLRCYETLRLKKPLTLGFRGGYQHSYGEVPFYHLASIGQRDNLRGYLRNRFLGERAAYANFDLRLHLGTVKTAVIPFGVGLTGFADTGRVWAQGNERSAWHRGYGGGFYLSPINDNFNLLFSFSTSREERLMFEFSFGASL